MSKYILACGQGGCWSGYTNARVVEAASLEDANGAAFHFAVVEFPSGGISYQAFDCGDMDPKELGSARRITGGRLKPSAMLMIKFDY